MVTYSQRWDWPQHREHGSNGEGNENLPKDLRVKTLLASGCATQHQNSFSLAHETSKRLKIVVALKQKTMFVN
jgi:hypothetical protein